MKKNFILACLCFTLISCLPNGSHEADTHKFILLNQSLEYALDVAHEEIEILFAELKKKVKKDGNTPEGISTIERAEELKIKTTKVFNEIAKIKKELAYQMKSPEKLVDKIMIGSNKQGKAYELKKKLDEYIHYLNIQFAEDKSLNFDGRFGLISGDDKQTTFIQTTVAAATAMLTQKQIEIMRYGRECLKRLGMSELGRITYFEKYIPMVSAESNIVEAGKDYKARLFLADVSGRKPTNMKCNDTIIRINDYGIGEVSFTAKGKGKKTWIGTITVNQRGKDTTFVVQKEYEVIEPIKRK